MLYLLTWKGRPEQRDQAIQRFVKTGGRPPQGVTMVGRWHAVGRVAGVAILECEDAGRLQQWTLDWSDLFEMEITPAISDEQMGTLLASLAPR